jgi:ribosomal protein L34E
MMPAPHLRSSRYVRKNRKTAKGTRTVWVKSNKRKRVYDLFGRELHGLGGKKGLTSKRPSRPFAGVLSAKTFQDILKWAVKAKKNLVKLEEVPIRLRKLVEHYTSRL